MAPMTVRATPRMMCGRYPSLLISFRTADSSFFEMLGLRTMIILFPGCCRGLHKKNRRWRPAAGLELFLESAQPHTPTRGGKVKPPAREAVSKITAGRIHDY